VKPNVIFIFADQWRAQATGYAGNAQVRTPNLDALALQSVNLSNACSGIPVCTPYRASFLTGQYAHTHGLFMNDAHLEPNGESIAHAFAGAGYDTAYVGKWHVNGQGRTQPIARDSRLGFDYWKVLECTHNYNHSEYYEGDSTEKQVWEGYDAEAQAFDVADYISRHDGERPFFLTLSWGPPHDPYQTAPERFRNLYDPDDKIGRASCRERV
jgi:arylsulfatase A-like enzyme